MQRGYLSAMEEEEKILSHSSMMVDGFGVWNIKRRSHGVTRALSLRTTVLSLGSMSSLMECSKKSMYPFFLQIFMRRFSWEDSFMDLIFSIPTMYGKKLIYVHVDCSIEYFHPFAIYTQCISLQKSKIIFGLCGHFRASLCNVDNPFLHYLGQVHCCFDHVQWIYVAAYYLIVDEKTCIAGSSMEDHFPHDVLNQ